MKFPRVIPGVLALSMSGFLLIVTSEGYKETAYIPVEGDVATIGFGTTLGVKAGDSTTPVRALLAAAKDVERFQGAVRRCVQSPLTQDEFDAFVSLAYNIGETAFCTSTLVKRANALDYAGACSEILRWNRFKGRVLQGLVNRREREFLLCKRGEE
jgi:lysozyme